MEPRESVSEKLDSAHQKLDKILEWIDGPPSKSHEGMKVRFDRVERLTNFIVGVGKIALSTAVVGLFTSLLIWLGIKDPHHPQ